MNQNEQLNFYKEIEELLISSVEYLRQGITEKDLRDVEEFINHGEYGLASDLLFHLTVENNLKVPPELNFCIAKMSE